MTILLPVSKRYKLNEMNDHSLVTCSYTCQRGGKYIEKCQISCFLYFGILPEPICPLPPPSEKKPITKQQFFFHRLKLEKKLRDRF